MVWIKIRGLDSKYVETCMAAREKLLLEPKMVISLQKHWQIFTLYLHAYLCLQIYLHRFFQVSPICTDWGENTFYCTQKQDHKGFMIRSQLALGELY